jgi:hypothetical protein
MWGEVSGVPRRGREGGRGDFEVRTRALSLLLTAANMRFSTNFSVLPGTTGAGTAV